MQCPGTVCRQEVGSPPSPSLEDLLGEGKLRRLPRELEDNLIKPNQDIDVSLGYFEDLPGFELITIHLASESDNEGVLSDKALSISHGTGCRPVEPPALRIIPYTGNSLLGAIFSIILASLVSRTSTSSAPSLVPPRVSLGELLEVFVTLIMSLFLLIIYECFGIYLYVKELPKPPPFLWKSIVAALLVLGLKYLRYGII